MARFTRNPWPKKVVWRQDDVTHDRFFWLSLPDDAAKAGDTVAAEVNGQVVRVTADPGSTGRLVLRLSDELVNLDQPVEVVVNQKPAFKGTVPRTMEAIAASLRQRADPTTAATATLDLKW
jgi:hypothetical protein